MTTFKAKNLLLEEQILSFKSWLQLWRETKIKKNDKVTSPENGSIHLKKEFLYQLQCRKIFLLAFSPNILTYPTFLYNWLFLVG